MNELRIIIQAVTADAQKNMQAVKKELQGISKEAKTSSEKFSAAMKGIAKAATVAITAITAIVTALVALGKSTLDTQKQMAQLSSAYIAAGKSAKDAATVYKDFYRFLGDSDTAVEASNLLIKLTQDEQNLAEWTKILQGVYASFPDSLPIEALVESANETARVGKVTGNLADALNWAGENEDSFNEKLAQTTTLGEREALIRSTLNGLYGTAAAVYEQNNSALLEYNESQADLQAKTAELGATITPLMVYLNNLGATIVSIVKPAFETVIPYIAGFVLWLTEAINRVAAFFGLVSSSSESVEAVGERTSKALATTKAGTAGVVNGLNNVKKAAEAAKKAAMGFDELNIVPSGKTSSGSGVSGDTGLNTSIPDMSGLAGITDMAGSLDEFKQKAEEVRISINNWMEEWGWMLDTIAAILAGLSIRNLLIQFGTAIGLGEQFKKALSFTGIAGGITYMIGEMGAFVALLKEGNSFWSVMAAAFPKAANWLAKIGAAFKGFSFKSLLAGIKSVGSKFGWIGAIIVAVISAITYAIDYWNDVVRIFKTFVNETIAPQIQKIKDLFVEMGDAIVSAIPESWWEAIKAAWSWVVDTAIPWLVEAFGMLWDIIGGVVFHTTVGVVMSAINAIISAVTGIIEVVTGVVQIVVGVVETLVKTIIAIFTGNWEAVMEPLQKIWDGVVNIFKGLYDATIGVIVEFVKGIISWFTELWDVLVGNSIVPDMIEAIIDWFVQLPRKIFELIANFVKTIIEFFADLATTLGEWAVTVWDYIKAPFAAVGNWFKNIFSAAANGIKTAFSGITSFFSGIWTSIKNIFSKVGEVIGNAITNTVKRAVNGVLSIAISIINGFIKAINMAISVINLIPGVEINKIRELEVPKLAKGGIVDQATLALIGERGKEAVVPLENNTEWIDKLVDKLAARNSTPSRIVLMLDGKELGWANINSINNITRQTGSLQLVMA